MTKKPSDILIESEGKRKQNFTSLVSRTPSGEIQDYCALGAIGCELGLIKNNTGAQTTSYIIKKISKVLNVPQFFELERFMCPICKVHEQSIGWVVAHMNDKHKLTFKEIGIWLRNIGL